LTRTVLVVQNVEKLGVSLEPSSEILPLMDINCCIKGRSNSSGFGVYGRRFFLKPSLDTPVIV